VVRRMARTGYRSLWVGLWVSVIDPLTVDALSMSVLAVHLVFVRKKCFYSEEGPRR
jgi:hypothetical protein